MDWLQRTFALGAAGALAMQPAVAAAQQAACVTEDEVRAIAIYSVPSVIQSVRLRCGSELAAGGYLARSGDALVARYAALQNGVWPQARTGLTKILASKAGESRQGLDVISRLPDQSVRPFVDALIVQELAPKFGVQDCWKIERVVEAIAPVDPEVAGTLIGVAAGVAQPEQVPICRSRSQ